MERRIIFNAEKHEYRNPKGDLYTSVSQLIRKIEPKFPEYVVARNIAKRDNITIEEVLSEWKAKKNRAADVGKRIHEAMDSQIVNNLEATGADGDYWMKIAASTWDIFKDYKAIDSEEILHSEEYGIAGTTDRICYRNKKVVDVRDFKTNEAKGIQYQNEQNQFLGEPLSWLEHTNYNTAALQLSSYAYLIEMTRGYKIGNLAIIFIPPYDPLNFEYIPVPYMKAEVKLLFEHHKATNNIESLPQWGLQPFS